jgi:hypothetical protein
MVQRALGHSFCRLQTLTITIDHYLAIVSFGCDDKLAEKHCWLICCERKILFWQKNKLKSTDYKPDE